MFLISNLRLIYQIDTCIRKLESLERPDSKGHSPNVFLGLSLNDWTILARFWAAQDQPCTAAISSAWNMVS